MTTDAKTHSPGPWESRPTHFGHSITAPDMDEREMRGATRIMVADVAQDANARLIATAPELLAALETTVSVIEQLVPEPSALGVADVVLYQARAAIAKARGES